MALISCENVSLGYEGVTVIKDINFKLENKDYLCIVGENGTGKSTLIKALLNLIKPMDGKITTSDELKRNEIGYLPQQTDVQKDFPASVSEVVLSGRINRLGIKPFFSKADKKEARKNMELMGIWDIRNKCYNELSGGQQQRVLLARALCATQKVILLDEPVAGLDPIVTQELYELIDKVNKEFDITVIMVSHDVEAAIRYSTHILHLSNSECFFGTTGEYLDTQEGKRFAGGAN